ncbi:hypothetical protein [Nocardioides ultimimeridianus]
MFPFSTATREEWVAYNEAEAEFAESIGEHERAAQHRANIEAADAMEWSK